MAQAFLVKRGKVGGSAAEEKSLNVNFFKTLYSRFGTGTTGIDGTYTAEKKQLVLAICCETAGVGASQKYTSAQITTTGTKIWDKTQSLNYVANTSRDCALAMSLISLNSGDTIAFQNSHSNQYNSQVHLIFEVSNQSNISKVLFETVIDNQKSNTFSFTPTAAGKYIILDLQASPYSSLAATEITSLQETSSYSETPDSKISISIGQYNLTTEDIVTLSTTIDTAYGTKIFAAWYIPSVNLGGNNDGYIQNGMMRYYDNSNVVSNNTLETLDKVLSYPSYSFEICCKVTGFANAYGSARIIEFGGAVISIENNSVLRPSANSDFAINCFQYAPTGTSGTQGPIAFIDNLNFGQTHTYTYVSDGSTTTKFYFDGNLISSADVGLALNRSTIYIMRASTVHAISGEWYNVRSYNRELTDEEIAINYRLDQKNYNSGINNG